MKLLIATGIFPPDVGGPATYVPFLASACAKSGNGIRVVTYGSSAVPDSVAYSVTRVPRYPLPLRYFLFFVACVRQGFGADAVFAQDGFSSGIPAACAAFLLRKPFFVKIVGDFSWEYARNAGITADGLDAFNGRTAHSPTVRGIRFFQRFVCRRARRVIVPSRYLEKTVAGWGVPVERIAVISNAVPRPEGGLPAVRERFLVFSAGRLVPWKGFDGLIRAFARIRREFPSARLVIAGDGPCRAELEAGTEQEGVAHAVTFLGTVSAAEMGAWYSRATCFALFSSYEGLSHAILEAFAHGLPVIASDAGGNGELLSGNALGTSVPSGDEAALEGALLSFFRGPDRAVPVPYGPSPEETVAATLSVLAAV